MLPVRQLPPQNQISEIPIVEADVILPHLVQEPCLVLVEGLPSELDGRDLRATLIESRLQIKGAGDVLLVDLVGIDEKSAERMGKLGLRLADLIYQRAWTIAVSVPAQLMKTVFRETANAPGE
jgi:hypothetical protein